MPSLNKSTPKHIAKPEAAAFQEIKVLGWIPGRMGNKRLSSEYIRQWTESKMDDIKRAAGRSTFAENSKKAFRPFEIVALSQSVAAAYTETTGAIYDKILDGVSVSQSLTKLRDTILPKLISGELGIFDSKQLTKETLT
ncbi:hypothetical protein [Roseibacillus ishigakijimensis]|uniref:Uncharacterized protein n=1 Tax=Roseibacillus ishigakijimensis TaxID=454146 RepID=A0A934RLI6_9BACT|nr:hypothetical protein [Roseibacillus ishigakijimensis]MBK1833048.1 hypothetical protein [Roseibacillus ishigakijimensis]